MSVDVDDLDRLIERALVEEGTSMTPAPDAWERFRERLDDSASAGGPPASRGWLLVAAAVVAGFGGLAAALLMLTGGDGEVRTAEPSVDAADDASSGTTLDVASEGARQPGSLLVVTADGRLVRVDTDSGEVDSTFVDGYDDLVIDNAAVGLDDTVLFSTCCEPAAGMTYRLEPDGEHTFLGYGYNPAFSPDGLAFSLVQPMGITLHDLDGNVTRTIDGGGHYGNVMAVAWSPQGDRLAVEVANGSSETQVLLLPVDATSLDEATPAQPDEGRWWAQPAFLADGTLLVAEHPQGQAAADAARETSVLREVTQDGRPAGPTDPGAPPFRLTADRTGTSALVVAPDGTTLVRAPTGAWSTLIPPGDTVLADAADIAW